MNEEEQVVETIRKSIVFGEADKYLERLKDAINYRQTQLRENKKFDLKISLKCGDKVKIVGGIRPASIVGMIVEVVKVNREKVICKFPIDPRARRFSGHEQVSVPLSSLELISSVTGDPIKTDIRLKNFLESA